VNWIDGSPTTTMSRLRRSEVPSARRRPRVLVLPPDDQDGGRNAASAGYALPMDYSDDDDDAGISPAPAPNGRGPRRHSMLTGPELSNPARFGGPECLDTTFPAPEGHGENGNGGDDGETYKVYGSRWIMLGYLSAMNLMSDWTCYSVAPIAALVNEAYGGIRPTALVCTFLGANAIASACEPLVLSRLGLRRTITLGSLLLALGSLIKSGIPYLYAPPPSAAVWRIYVAFAVVGLSQPLYQCTPALLSASWFPERERTTATGIALNSNQIGIGCSFVVGTWMVGGVEDIPTYFSAMSLISTIIFVGALLQFDDAPPTPPSASARIIRGTLTIPLPRTSDIWRLVPSWENSCGRPGLRLARPLRGTPANDSFCITPLSQHRGPAPFFTPGPEGDSSHNSVVPPSVSSALYTPFPGLRGVVDDISLEDGGEPYFIPTPLPALADLIEEGAEPVAISSCHGVQIKLRDDQVLLSVRALWRRVGFSHTAAAFVMSAVVINTLSTYMDYLVSAGGGNRKALGIVGGAFQVVVMASSLLFGKLADGTRAYYVIVVVLLVAGAVTLGCAGMALDNTHEGPGLFISLLLVAATVGPLQPIATEMGVEVAYPLSENTVLVAQQLFANLLSTLFIPVFQILRDVGTNADGNGDGGRPQYMFSFYTLIVLHACTTVFFATFGGTYRRLEHELSKKKPGDVVHESEVRPLLPPPTTKI